MINRPGTKARHPKKKSLSREKSQLENYNSLIQNRINQRERILKEYTKANNDSKLSFVPNMNPLKPRKYKSYLIWLFM